MYYPTRRKVRRLNNRQRKKYKVEEHRIVSKKIEMVFSQDITPVELEDFSDQYWSYVLSVGLDSQGFTYDESKKEGELKISRHLLGWNRKKYKRDYTYSCSDQQLEDVLGWLKKQRQVQEIRRVWTDDSKYCVLTWRDDTQGELLPSFNMKIPRHRASFQWQTDWFRRVNNCSTSCGECTSHLCW